MDVEERGEGRECVSEREVLYRLRVRKSGARRKKGERRQ